MSECLFCRIASKEIKSDIVYEDDKVIAFNDIDPKAPVHILIIPKKHIPTFIDIKGEDIDLVSHIHQVLINIASEKKLSDGFRVIVNCGAKAGQSVYHLHFHLLAGRKMLWPPG